MKTCAALCINGFSFGSQFFPKEVAVCDVNNNYNSIIYLKLSKPVSEGQSRVFDWQTNNIHSLGWSFPESTVPLGELSIVLRQIQQYFILFVESPFLQKYLFDSFATVTAVIPQDAIPLSQTSEVYCGISQHCYGFVCALRRASNNAKILNQWTGQ